MTADDFDAFTGEFRRLSRALERFKSAPVELQERADAYFHVLKRFSFELVRAKGDAWLKKESKFPTPAQWAAQYVTLGTRELPVMSDADAREFLRAERLGFEDPDPCECRVCLDAEMASRPEHLLRYVPIEDIDGHAVRAREPITKRIVTPGRWIHGFELVRWYQARAKFWAEAYARLDVKAPQQKTLEKLPFEQRLAQLFPSRKTKEVGADWKEKAAGS